MRLVVRPMLPLEKLPPRPKLRRRVVALDDETPGWRNPRRLPVAPRLLPRCGSMATTPEPRRPPTKFPPRRVDVILLRLRLRLLVMMLLLRSARLIRLRVELPLKVRRSTPERRPTDERFRGTLIVTGPLRVGAAPRRPMEWTRLRFDRVTGARRDAPRDERVVLPIRPMALDRLRPDDDRNRPNDERDRPTDERERIRLRDDERLDRLIDERERDRDREVRPIRPRLARERDDRLIRPRLARERDDRLIRLRLPRDRDDRLMERRPARDRLREMRRETPRDARELRPTRVPRERDR